MNYKAGIQQLAEAGLNLVASVPCGALPDGTQAMMVENGVPLADYETLVLLGHGGRQLWESMTEADWAVDDPIDSYSVRQTQQFIDTYLANEQNLLLFPTDYLVPLQQIGRFVGWAHQTPLGLGIHPEYGVWFAYRAAFLTTAVLSQKTEPMQPSQCDSCTDKPCISDCPAGAVGWKRPFNVEACAAHRLKVHSSCANRCLSRMACPVAPQHRYTIEQINYHYDIALDTFKQYFPHLMPTDGTN